MNALRRLFAQLLGPAAVMAAGTMGAGAAASLVLAGAWFRYELLWVIPLILPLFVVSVDSAAERSESVSVGPGDRSANQASAAARVEARAASAMGLRAG